VSGQIKGSLPLAFILAMAAEVAAGSAGGSEANVRALGVGSLSSLLVRATDAQTTEPTVETSPNVIPLDRMAQWSNFRNCVTGSWRNC
jgi:hypothetical protein